MATATAASRARPTTVRVPATVFIALTRRALRDARARTLGFAYLFLAVAYIQPVAYRHTYSTLAERISFAHSFADNKAVVLFYGRAYDLLTVGGYSAWRVGGTLTIFAAVFGLLAAVRALRAEEEAGRAELILAAPVGRSTMVAASLAATALAAVLLGLATLIGLTAGGLPAGGSAYLALAVVSVIPVFVAVGALASQLATTKRLAIELGGAIVALCLLARVVADTVSDARWLSWMTPLGWAEQLRPFTGAQPLVLLAPAAATVLIVVPAIRIAAGRDLRTGLLATRERSQPRLRLLSSAAGQALRGEWIGLLIWMASVGALALVIGIVSNSVSSLAISRQLEHTLEQLGVGSALTPTAYIGFAFGVLVLIVSLFAISQLSAAHRDELEGRLETLLALPLSRGRWLGERLALAAIATTALSLWAGVLVWVGAVSQGVSLSLGAMLEAGANCLPVAVLSLGVAVLLHAALPRVGSAVAYGLLVVAYLWQLFGELLGAPKWLVQATPFAHVGAVPAASFLAPAAGIMVGVGLLAALAALATFRRRDLVGS